MHVSENHKQSPMLIWYMRYLIHYVGMYKEIYFVIITRNSNDREKYISNLPHKSLINFHACICIAQTQWQSDSYIGGGEYLQIQVLYLKWPVFS